MFNCLFNMLILVYFSCFPYMCFIKWSGTRTSNFEMFLINDNQLGTQTMLLRNHSSFPLFLDPVLPMFYFPVYWLLSNFVTSLLCLLVFSISVACCCLFCVLQRKQASLFNYFGDNHKQIVCFKRRHSGYAHVPKQGLVSEYLFFFFFTEQGLITQILIPN